MSNPIDAGRPHTLICLASNFKGLAFLKQAKELGCSVILLTRETMQGENSIPRGKDGLRTSDRRD